MAKKSANAKKEVIKPVHGIAVGVLLLLLKGILGVTAALGLFVIFVSSLLYLAHRLQKSN